MQAEVFNHETSSWHTLSSVSQEFPSIGATDVFYLALNSGPDSLGRRIKKCRRATGGFRTQRYVR